MTDLHCLWPEQLFFILFQPHIWTPFYMVLCAAQCMFTCTTLYMVLCAALYMVLCAALEVHLHSTVHVHLRSTVHVQTSLQKVFSLSHPEISYLLQLSYLVISSVLSLACKSNKFFLSQFWSIHNIQLVTCVSDKQMWYLLVKN